MRVESNSVATAIRLYKEDNGQYPVSASFQGQMLNENDSNSARKTAYQQSMELLVPKYLSEVPTSPSGSGYSYMVSDDGAGAVFAASLSAVSSGGGSNKNSCDFVSPGYDSCVIEIGPLTCSDITYNNQTQECFDVESGQGGGVCSINGDCEGYSTSSSVPDEACSWLGTPDTVWICPYPEFSGNKTAVCELNNSVCSGGSSLDYCSCI